MHEKSPNSGFFRAFNNFFASKICFNVFSAYICTRTLEKLEMNEHVLSFLKYIRYERNYSECTVEAYADDLRRFEEYVTLETGSFDPLQPDVDLVRSWMAEQGKVEKAAASSIKRRLCCLRSFYRYLRRNGLIANNPLSLLPSPKVPHVLPVWINEEQMDHLLDDIDYGQDFSGVRDHLLIDMLYTTGMRRSEAARLRDADIDLGNHQLKVLGKGNKERIIPFGPELETLIVQYRERRDAEVGFTPECLFTDDEGKPFSPSKVTTTVHKYLENIPSLSRKGAHVLRHSFATNMLAEGADLMSVKELLGHASLQSTEVYTHLTPKEILDNYKHAHPRAK